MPHEQYRLGRLCYMLVQNKAFVDTFLDNIEQEKVVKMRTTMLTKYPENKEVRGIMKLVNRTEDKQNVSNHNIPDIIQKFVDNIILVQQIHKATPPYV